jgi:hypothetical protein
MQQILSIIKSQLQDDVSSENIKEWETGLAIVTEIHKFNLPDFRPSL